MTKKCDGCINAELREVGYSCYTIEGTYLHCGFHPQSGFDRWYGEDEKLKYAEQCPFFISGDPDFTPYCDGNCGC